MKNELFVFLNRTGFENKRIAGALRLFHNRNNSLEVIDQELYCMIIKYANENGIRHQELIDEL